MSPVLVLLALVAVVLAALWLETHVRPLRKIGSAATAILLALALSNLGLIPGRSPVYDFMLSQAVIAGIVLILLNVRLASIREAGAPMLAAFGIGAAGSAIGAVIMARLLAGAIGPDAWRLSGQFAATYIGGGMNFAAVGEQLHTRSDLFTAGIAADVIVTAIWLVASLVLPELLARRGGVSRSVPGPSDPSPRPPPPALTRDPEALDAQLQSSGVPLTLTDFAGLMTLTLGIMWTSARLAALVPAVPMIIWLTTIVLVLAQVPIVQRLSGGVVIGYFLLLLFLASNGAKSVIAHIVQVGPAIFYFAAGTVAIHGLILFGLGYALRMDGDLLSVASQANVGGSATALALAGARRRTDLILPGVAVGMLGNALGNYVGIAIAFGVRALLR